MEHYEQLFLIFLLFEGLTDPGYTLYFILYILYFLLQLFEVIL